MKPPKPLRPILVTIPGRFSSLYLYFFTFTCNQLGKAESYPGVFCRLPYNWCLMSIKYIISRNHEKNMLVLDGNCFTVCLYR